MNIRRTLRKLPLMALLLSIFLGGCVCDLGDSVSETEPDKSPAADKPRGDASAQAETGKDGRFILQFQKPKQPELKELAAALEADEAYKKYVADLNANIRIPHDIPISFESCDETNAFYDPEKRRVMMCYEMVQYIIELSQDLSSDDDFSMAITGATLEILLHEAGHALVDVLDLPLTGKEEDAVDQIAMFILLSYEEEGEAFALASADFHLRMDADENVHPEEMAFWSQHSFTLQRYYNSMCFVYGKDPEKHAEMVGGDHLPEERANSCPEEYEKLNSSWSRILSPHFKEH